MNSLRSSCVIKATLYYIFLATTSLYPSDRSETLKSYRIITSNMPPLTFAFKNGAPTKVLVKEIAFWDGGNYEVFEATLSDETSHKETIRIGRLRVAMATGMYDYVTTRRNCLDDQKVKLDDRNQEYNIFVQLKQRLEEQKEQERLAKVNNSAEQQHAKKETCEIL